MDKSYLKVGDIVVFMKDCFFYEEEYKVGDVHKMRESDVGHNFEEYCMLLGFDLGGVNVG
jgi:hypothetical protein